MKENKMTGSRGQFTHKSQLLIVIFHSSELFHITRARFYLLFCTYGQIFTQIAVLCFSRAYKMDCVSGFLKECSYILINTQTVITLIIRKISSTTIDYIINFRQKTARFLINNQTIELNYNFYM